MNWWLYTLLVSWITLGIAGIYYFYGACTRGRVQSSEGGLLS